MITAPDITNPELLEYCSYVHEYAQAAITIGTTTLISATSAEAITSAAGITAVTHSSGLPILTGSTGYLAGSYAAIGTWAAAAAPILATGAMIAGGITLGSLALCGIL